MTALVVLAALQQPAAASPEEGCLTAKINSERQAKGARSLSTHSDLVAIARRHSARMAQDQRYYHNSNLRNELPRGWRSEGENVGWASDCAHMHSFFMNSPSHRKNILNPAFDQIGVGVIVDSDGRRFWVTEVFMESSGSPGFSTESRAALEAPPSEAAAPAQAEADPAPVREIASSEETAPAPPANPSPKQPKASSAGSSGSKTKLASPPLAGVPQPLAAQQTVKEEPEWDDWDWSRAPFVFDLEQAR